MIRCGLCNQQFETGKEWQQHMNKLHDYVTPLVDEMLSKGGMISTQNWVQWLMARINRGEKQ